MIIRKLPLWVLFGLVLLLAPLKVQAACGSWIASPEGCYDESSTRIEGETVMCGRGSACCSTIEECSPQEEDPFGGIDEPVTPVDEPEEPAPTEPVPEDDPPPAPTDPVCAGNTMGPCPAGQSCQQMILSGGARQNSCQPTGNPQEILDPSDDGWPMSEDEITDALYEHCGTYYANDSGGRCVDINTDDISPFTLCSGAGGGGSTSCCSSTLYCQLAFEDVVDLEPADKEDESRYVCGEYVTAGYTRGCYGNDSKLIPEAVDCSVAGFPTMCCISEEKCGADISEKRPTPKKFNYCTQVPGDAEDPTSQRYACVKCMGEWDEKEERYSNEGKKIFSAVGCISVNGKDLAQDLIRLLLGIAGGVAFLSILAAAFHFTISRGESNKIKEAKDLLTAAISGLLFMIFSIIILNFIGVEVLHLPGLGGDGSGGGSGSGGGGPQPQPPPVERAIPGSLYTGEACTANYECNQGMALSICRDGTCQPTLKAVTPCSEQADPTAYCQAQTGYDQSSCVAYAPNIEFCTLDDSVEERIKPYGSVPIGGKCSRSLECVQVLEFDGKTVNINPKCLDDVCELSFISSALACHTQSDPDGYCQEALSSSEAYCSNLEGEPAQSTCRKPPAIPESITCQDSAYCNELYRTQDEYECHVPSGNPGGTIGYCQRKQN